MRNNTQTILPRDEGRGQKGRRLDGNQGLLLGGWGWQKALE